MINLSRRVQQVKPSATLAITAKAAELRARGRDIISLSVGEPEFETPRHVRAAAIEAIHSGFTRYTAVAGIPELRAAIAEKLNRENDLSYTPEEVAVSSGGKQGIYNLMQAVLNPDDEVIIPTPYWVSYPDMALLAEAKPVLIEAKEATGLKITPEQLAAAITPKTRMLVMNSPSNPTGMVYSKGELRALGKILMEYSRITILSDEMYEKIVFDGLDYCSFATANPDLKGRTITLGGVSKAYCMTGWRIGYAAGPTHLIKAMGKIQSQSTSNPGSISQKAALAAIIGPQDDLEHMVKTYQRRREWLLQRLNSIPGMRCLKPEGAFYLFPNVQNWLGSKTPSGDTLNDDVDVCAWLLEETGIAIVPGTAFGAPGYVRFSYAVSQSTLEDACERIEKAVAQLSLTRAFSRAAGECT
ncbi:MAG: pyridoxal phosphate-dependent aminotransferase [Mariprofundaceae bacterium]